MKDLIIDCFAGGGGASVGIEMALGRPVDIAINHDPDAILIHKTNHPDTLHLTEDIFKVDLQKYIKGQHVALMWASPDCTSHSKAKGGKPREKGLRILPWAVYKHAKAILPEVIIMENVEEIQQWGPLDAAGHPIKERKGEDYKRFITAMKSLGYIFDSRELVAADYGASTTRETLVCDIPAGWKRYRLAGTNAQQRRRERFTALGTDLQISGFTGFRKFHLWPEEATGKKYNEPNSKRIGEICL